MNNINEVNKNNNFIRKKISCLLISFYSGICVISDIGVKYYFKDKKKVDTASLSKILLLFKVPYLLKPLYGLILDFYPLFGYKKKSFLFICFFINIISWYIFIISKNEKLFTPIICHFFINMSLSFTTVIGSAIQVDISKMYKKTTDNYSKKTSELMSEHFIIKSVGTLIPSYLKGYLIEKYSNNIIFYISGLFSFFILSSGIILDEEKSNKNKKILYKTKQMQITPLIEEEKENNNYNQIIDLIKNKNIVIFLTLIFILESSPTCVSPLFYYETNILGLNPKNLSLIDFYSQIAIILVIIIYKNFCWKLNFKSITCFVRISIFGIFYLIYLLIIKITQKYISDLYLVTFTTAFYGGLHSLGQLPYSLLAIQLSPLTLEATTYSLCIFSCYLGNIFADYIDYILAICFNVTHYNFENLHILVLIENILNLIPLFYVIGIPYKFFSENKADNNPQKELETIQEEKN